MTAAILVATMGRTKELEQIAKHLIDSAGYMMALYFIVDVSDEESIIEVNRLAVSYKRVHAIIMDRNEVPGFNGPGKCYQYGYENTTEELVYITGDDMFYEQGWLAKAVEELGDKGVLAVADANSGSWCVFLFRRSYVEEKSCMEDRANTILNVDYDRIADSELVFTLQNRGDIAYASFYVDHKSPVFYGRCVLSEDKQSKEISYNQYLIRDLAIPYSEVKADIVKNDLSGVANILRIQIVPNKPMVVNNFRYDHYSEDKAREDEKLLKERAHLWGGRLYHQITPRIGELAT